MEVQFTLKKLLNLVDSEIWVLCKDGNINENATVCGQDHGSLDLFFVRGIINKS